MMIVPEDIRISEFRVNVIKYLDGSTPVVNYEAIEPAELYTIPNWAIAPQHIVLHNTTTYSG